MDAQELRERLEYHKQLLAEYRAAYMALVSGRAQEYAIGDRSLKKIDIYDLRKGIEEEEKKVDELTEALNGRKPRKAFGIVPRF